MLFRSSSINLLTCTSPIRNFLSKRWCFTVSLDARYQLTLTCSRMKDIFIPLVHLLTTVAKLLGPGGAKAIIAENLLLKQQLLVITRSRRRAPNLSNADRFLMGFWSLFLRPGRIAKVAVSIRPSTLSKFHQHLVRRKYRRLFSSRKRTKPGPKGPPEPLISAIVELKRRNRGFGCPRIALIISKTFGIEIDKHVVRRVLAKHYRPESGGCVTMNSRPTGSGFVVTWESDGQRKGGCNLIYTWSKLKTGARDLGRYYLRKDPGARRIAHAGSTSMP